MRSTATAEAPSTGSFAATQTGADRSRPTPRAGALPPGPRGLRALTVGRFMLQPTRFLEGCSRRYGEYFTVVLSPERTVVITSDPEAVRAAFTGNPDELRAGEGNVVLRPLLGEHSVLLADGAEHMRQRKLILPAFHGERMRAYGEVMRAAAERRIARWPVGRPFATQPSMQAITLEVILRAVFGVASEDDAERLGAPLKRLLDAAASRPRLVALQVTSSKHPRPRSPWGRFRRLVDAADSVIYEQIASRRRDADRSRRDDVLSLLLDATDEAGRGLGDRELRDELMTLLLAGHETTATALAWTLTLLTHHPAVLQRLRRECDLGGDEYLDAVIAESLRLRPVVPAVARYLTVPLELPSITLPAGVHLTPSIYLLHRRPDLYPDPGAFRPERFLGRRPGTYEWIPFGGGVRRCLGASFAQYEMKIVLGTVLNRTELRPASARLESVSRRAITFAPGRGGRIAIRARSG
jgi:cytochrome P450 family 135